MNKVSPLVLISGIAACGGNVNFRLGEKEKCQAVIEEADRRMNQVDATTRPLNPEEICPDLPYLQDLQRKLHVACTIPPIAEDPRMGWLQFAHSTLQARLAYFVAFYCDKGPATPKEDISEPEKELHPPLRGETCSL